MKSQGLFAIVLLSFAASAPGVPPPVPGGESTKPASIDFNDGRRFWSFQPVRKTEPPPANGSASAWAATPIDQFVIAKLVEKQLEPAVAADKRTLIRRATFDLIGLPPTPAEIDAFLADHSADAYEKLIDRLLASPRFGEAQARAWLDIARYAEDQAHTFAVKPYTNAYRYRDWVIDSFNDDMPYDRFVKLQIAADLMDDGSPDSIKQRAALGFFGLGAQYYKNSEALKAAADELDDRVDTLTRGFLGLTVSCARCHDHKFDPIPTQDYYSIAGIFWSSRLADVSMGSRQEVERYQEGQQKVRAAESKVNELFQAVKSKLIGAKIEQLPRYFIAVWKLETRRLTQPDFSAEMEAKLDKLDSQCLDKLTRFMNRKSQAIAALEGWRRNLPKVGGPSEPPAEVVKAADEFAVAVKAMIGKAGAGKSKDDMMQSLFGEKGIFPITEADVVGTMPSDSKQEYQVRKRAEAEAARSAPPMPPAAHGLAEAEPVDLKVFVRGNPANQGDLAPRRFLHVLAGDNPPLFKKGSGRLELAAAIADPHNPLTARVMVNRLWQQHFGRGIVGTPSNFGAMGERPTHPELLDYLAVRFVESGWSIKRMHREIMLSSAYQQSSAPNERAMQIDADNRLLWRMNRQRLKVEQFRDSLLAASGNLDLTTGGPTANLDDPANRRRTVYAKISRHELNGFLRLFDFPDANITSARRSETTVPQQQLFVLNSPFMISQAKAFAARLAKEAGDDRSRIGRAFVIAYGRPATDDDIALGLHYLNGTDSAAEAAGNKLTRWERYAQALLAGNEFLYID